MNRLATLKGEYYRGQLTESNGKINGHVSEKRAVTLGVLQWSILGPLLFTIYMNNFPKAITRSICSLFADNTAMFYRSSRPTNIQIVLHTELEIGNKWFARYKVNVDMDKTKFIVVQPKKFDNIKPASLPALASFNNITAYTKMASGRTCYKSTHKNSILLNTIQYNDGAEDV